jgi:dephospho-CoA kinase
MKVIGIAGETGTGKSTIGAHLAERHGGVHVDTDRIGHGLLGGDEDVVEAVRARFGDDVFDALGRVDRRALGARVFADEGARLDLNAIIHPAIRRVCGELVERARASGANVAVIDGALLLDSRMPFAFDLMIALRCDPDARFARVMAKGGWSEAEVRRRMASQGGVEKSFYKADAVVDTDGELDAVLAAVDRVVDPVMAP